MITTRASSRIKWLHGRMPVVLETTAREACWLDEQNTIFPENFFEPCNSSDLIWHPVTPSIGKLSFQGPECYKDVRTKGINRFFQSNIKVCIIHCKLGPWCACKTNCSFPDLRAKQPRMKLQKKMIMTVYRAQTFLRLRNQKIARHSTLLVEKGKRLFFRDALHLQQKGKRANETLSSSSRLAKHQQVLESLCRFPRNYQGF